MSKHLRRRLQVWAKSLKDGSYAYSCENVRRGDEASPSQTGYGFIGARALPSALATGPGTGFPVVAATREKGRASKNPPQRPLTGSEFTSSALRTARRPQHESTQDSSWPPRPSSPSSPPVSRAGRALGEGCYPHVRRCLV